MFINMVFLSWIFFFITKVHRNTVSIMAQGMGVDPVMTCLNISIALTLRRPALEKAMLFIFILNFGWSTANAVKFNFWIHEKRYTMPVLPCHHSMCVNISGWNQRQIPNDNFANHSKMESAEIFGKGFLFLCLEPWGKLYL